MRGSTDDRSETVEYQTKVKLYLEDEPTAWVVGAIVCLYDRDLVTSDDRLGTEVTNAYGEAVFRFRSEQFFDLDDRIGGALPELYVKVYDSEGKCVVSTRTDALSNAVPPLIRVPIERRLAERHRLV